MKKLAIASAVSAALCAGNAFALTPTEMATDGFDPQTWNPASPNGYVSVHFSGATAQSNAIEGLIENYCDMATYDIFTDAVSTNPNTDETGKVITCSMNSGPLSGLKLYFSYFLEGGSIWGVTPVADAIDLEYMRVVGNTSCAETTAGSGEWTCINNPDETSVVTQYSHAPEGGASDVEPELFKGANLPDGLEGWGLPVNPDNLFQQSSFVVTFGVPVHCAVLDWSVYTDCASSPYAIGNPTATGGNIVSLRKSTIAAIFKGDIIAWDDVEEADAAGTLQVIKVCRRVNGSGTQAAAQVYFLNQECSENYAYSFTTEDAPVGNVEEISSSTSILRNCVNGEALGDTVLPEVAGLPAPTIALSSLEKEPNSVSHGLNWAYVQIDEVEPTDANAAMGLYDYQFENSMQYRKFGPDAVTGDRATLLENFITEAKKSANLSKIGTYAVHDGSVDNTATIPFSDTNRVSWNSRDERACKPLYQVFPKTF